MLRNGKLSTGYFFVLLPAAAVREKYRNEVIYLYSCPFLLKTLKDQRSFAIEKRKFLTLSTKFSTITSA